MIERGFLRLLVIPGKTFYFLDGARQRGVHAECRLALETFLNKKLKRQKKSIDAGQYREGMNMNANDQNSKSDSSWSQPWVYMLRGWLMFLLGSTLVVLTAIKPHVTMLSKDFSWLPVIAMLLIVIGILRCLDGFMSPRSPRFQYNLQGGIFDSVVGFLVLFSVGDEPVLLGLLISGYLITQGLIRVILSFIVLLRNPTSIRVGGVLSLILGFLVWMQWPFPAAWFLSLSLSAEIALRGWALIELAGALKDQSTQS